MRRFKFGFELKFLFILVSVAVLPLIIVSIVWFTITRSQEISRASTEVSNVSQEAENDVQNFFANKVIGLMIHSQTDAVRSQNIHQASTELQDYLRQDQDVIDLVLLNSAGKEVSHVTPSRVYPASELSDDSGTPEFKVTTFVGGEQYISSVNSDSLGRPYVKIAVPVITSENITSLQHLTTSSFGTMRQVGEINGVLVATVEVQSLWDTLNSLKIGNDGYVFVVDDKGILLNYPHLTQQSNIAAIRVMPEVSRFINDLSTSSNENTSEFVEQSLNEFGQNALTIHRHISFTNWGIIAEVPMSDVLASINRLEIYAVILFLSTLLITVIVSLAISHQLVVPMRRLQQGTLQFGRGDLRYRINLQTNDELEDLADSFNSMATNLSDAFLKLNVDKDLIQGEKDKLNYVLSNITDGVIALDKTGNITLFNKTAGVITGYDAEKVLHKSIENIIHFYEDDKEIGKDTYLSLQMDTSDREYLFMKRHVQLTGFLGKSVFVNLICIKIQHNPNSDLGYILTLHDLTEELRLEKMKMDFVSMAAHELRTPLTIIKGYLSIFKQENQNKFSEDQMLFLDRIEMGAKQLTFMVENFLNVSRIERGALTISLQVINWVSFVHQIVDELKNEASVKKITLSFVEPVESTIQVQVDPVRIQEVLINLINNAINYTADGGKISVSLEVKENGVITHVSDTGAGIPAEAVKNLFTKFYRVSGDLTASSKGTGLGLFISKTIVEMHHGRIWVASVEGQGSVFSFSLPISASSA
jgi:two-component system sensor histidine kinase VicK